MAPIPRPDQDAHRVHELHALDRWRPCRIHRRGCLGPCPWRRRRALDSQTPGDQQTLIGSPHVGRGCFIASGRSLESAVDRVRTAEELGYDAVYVTHLAARESLTVVTAYALATSRIRVGTG